MASTSTDRRLGLNGAQAVKVPCDAAATVSVVLSGTQTVDGVALAIGMRCLCTNQATSGGALDNGIYQVQNGAWTRDLDANGNEDFVQGTLVPVYGGAANSGMWQCTTPNANPIVIGTNALTFVQWAAAGNVAYPITIAKGGLQRTDGVGAQLYCGLAGGSANVVTATSTPAVLAYVAGQSYLVQASNTNSGATTLNINGLGAVTVQLDGVALSGGEIVANKWVRFTYDGVRFQMERVNSGTSTLPNPLTYVLGGTSKNDGTTLNLYCGVTTGTANAITAASSPVTASYVAGQTYVCSVTLANTGPTTININGIGVVAVQVDGNALVGGEIAAQKGVRFTYDGTVFQMERINNGGGSTSGGASYYCGVTTGTANVITAAVSPGPAAYAAGQSFVCSVTLANTGATTLNINGIGAVNVQLDGNALVGGEMSAQKGVRFTYDGTAFQMERVNNGNPPIALLGASTGTANAAICAFPNDMVGPLIGGLRMQFPAVAASTGAAYSLAAGGTTARAVVNSDGSAIQSGQIAAGGFTDVIFNSTANVFQLMNPLPFGYSTFNPTMAFAGQSSAPTYNLQSGYCMAIGPMVFFSLSVGLATVGGVGGTATINGLPFACKSGAIFSMNPLAVACTGTGKFIGQMLGTNSIKLLQAGAGQDTVLTSTNFGVASEIDMSGFYFQY